MRVAEAAIAAAREHHALADIGEGREQGLAVLRVDLRAGRHGAHDVVTARAVAVLAHPAAAVLGLEVLLLPVADARIQPPGRLYAHVAAVAAVTAVESAELDEFLAPERHAAVPAVARADIDLGFVEKFHRPDMRPVVPKGESPRAAIARRIQSRQKLWENACRSIRREGPRRAMPH